MGTPGFAVRDASLVKTIALPAGASSVYTAGIPLNNSAKSSFVAPCELHVSIPSLTTGQLADASVITYSIEHDDDPAFGSPTTLQAAVLTQTGAAGAGAAAVEKRIGIPSDVKSNVRLKATKTGSESAAAVSATLELLF